MKKKNYATYLLLISLLTIFSLSMFGCEKKTRDPEVVAKEFLEGTFVVQSYDNWEKLEEYFISLQSSASEETGLVSYEINEELEELCYVKIGNLISDSLRSRQTLIATTNCLPTYERIAKEEGYTTTTKTLDLKPTGKFTETAKVYNYTLVLDAKYDDNTIKEKKVVGSIHLVKENDKWLVDYLEMINMNLLVL